MHLPKASALTPKLIWLDSAESTNSQLIDLAKSESLPDFTVMVTANQLAGRGRSGRVWQAPAGASLAISVLLRPQTNDGGDLNRLGWIPLLAGLAMSENVHRLLGEAGEIGVKWPNDVLVNEKKICGVLSELVMLSSSAAPQFGSNLGLVIGAGINVTLDSDHLPVPTATSLAIEGARMPAEESDRIDEVLAGYLERLSHWYRKFTDSRLSAQASGLQAAVTENCVSLGREVRAILPNGVEEVGEALAVDADGRLVLRLSRGEFVVGAGDIVHLRHN